MELSIFLAKVFGVFFLFVALALIVNKDDYKGLFASLVQDAGHIFLWGVLGVFLGLIFVMVHNVWDGGWRTIITLLAWGTLLKGVLSMLFPGLVYNMLKKANVENMYLLEFSLSVILGIVLSYFGFTLAVI